MRKTITQNKLLNVTPKICGELLIMRKGFWSLFQIPVPNFAKTLTVFEKYSKNLESGPQSNFYRRWWW